jgi:hypothetical protein
VDELRAKDALVRHLQGFRPTQTVLEVIKTDSGTTAAQQQAALNKKGKKRKAALLMNSVSRGADWLEMYSSAAPVDWSFRLLLA